MAQSTEKSSEYRTPTMMMWLEPPDLVCVRGYGDAATEDVRETTKRINDLIRGWPYVLVMVDQSQQASMSSDARRAATETPPGAPYRGTVFYGGSLVMRTVGQLVMRLINALRKTDNPAVFFRTEAEARAWIDQRRREIASPAVEKSA